MKYGWVDQSGHLTLDYHSAGDVYLTLLKNHTIGIPIHRTFRFVGYKTSLLRFLLDHSVYMFESVTDHLYMRGGEEMEDPGTAVAQAFAGRLGGALMSEIPTVVTTGMQVVAAAASHASTSVSKPGKVASAIDRYMNKRLIVDLDSMTSPKLNKYDSLEELPKNVTFANLAAYISNKF